MARKVNTEELSALRDMFTQMDFIGQATIVASLFVGVGIVDLLNIPMRKLFNMEFGFSYYLLVSIFVIIGTGFFQEFLNKDMPEYASYLSYSIIGIAVVVIGRKAYKAFKD